MSANVAVFVVAAFLEIAGCFTFWLWLRRGVSFPIAVVGTLSLVGFAFALTRVDSRVCRTRLRCVQVASTSLRR